MLVKRVSPDVTPLIGAGELELKGETQSDDPAMQLTVPLQNSP